MLLLPVFRPSTAAQRVADEVLDELRERTRADLLDWDETFVRGEFRVRAFSILDIPDDDSDLYVKVRVTPVGSRLHRAAIALFLLDASGEEVLNSRVRPPS